MSLTSGTWLIYIFDTAGSYQQNIEVQEDLVPDTLQYWIGDSIAWDIRTFSLDKDLRILQLDLTNFKQNPIEYLDGIAKNIYASHIKRNYRIDVSFPDIHNINEYLIALVSMNGLFPNARWTELDFPLWLPEKTDYYSHSDD